jgi:hypothetical protein
LAKAEKIDQELIEKNAELDDDAWGSGGGGGGGGAAGNTKNRAGGGCGAGKSNSFIITQDRGAQAHKREMQADSQRKAQIARDAQ